LRVANDTTAQQALDDLVRALTNERELDKDEASNTIHRALRAGESSTRYKRLVRDLMQQVAETPPRSVDADDDVL
jgi:translation elongation factor EF-Tu-like GTPase